MCPPISSAGCSYDSQLRCAVVDLYYVLYGRVQPSWIPSLSHFPTMDGRLKEEPIMMEEDMPPVPHAARLSRHEVRWEGGMWSGEVIVAVCAKNLKCREGI